MKKGTKMSVAVALTCIAAGCVFIGIGAAAGGGRQLKTGEFDLIHLESDELGFDLDDAGFDFIRDSAKELFADENADTGGRYDGEKTEDGVEVLSGDFERTIECDGRPEKLEIKVGVHMLEIREGDGQAILLEGKNCDRIQCYVENGTLYLKDVGKNKKYLKVRDRTLTLTVPEGIRWDDARISAAIGGVEADALDAQKMKLDVDMGNIDIDSLTAQRLEVGADMGNVELKNVQAGSLDVEAKMGNIDFEGVVNGNIEAEASMGSITLTLGQEEAEFNYEISAGMGSVTLDGADFGGLSHAKKIDNGADWRMELESSMGSIDIYFE